MLESVLSEHDGIPAMYTLGTAIPEPKVSGFLRALRVNGNHLASEVQSC